MNTETIKEFLYSSFPDVSIVKVAIYDDWISVYFCGFGGEESTLIRKAIIQSLTLRLMKRFPLFHFHIAHFTTGLN